MKINFVRNKEEELAGYKNIDIEGNTFMSILLDDEVDDAEAEEIRAVDVIEYFPSNETEKALTYWIKKLRHGGKLTLVSADAFEVARGFNYGKIDIDQFNLFLYGTEGSREIRKASLTIPQVVDYLSSKGLKINKARISNFRFIVEAIRP